jgi:peptidoglycan hydrolase-like amidase
MKAAILAAVLAVAVHAEPLCINVFGLFKPQELKIKAARNDLVRVAVGNTVAFAAAMHGLALRLNGAMVEVMAPGKQFSGTSVKLTSRNGGPIDVLLSVPGKIERHFRGILEVMPMAGVLHAVITVDVESAVAAAVKAETAPNAPLAALQAQAVVTRSYYLATGNRHKEYDYCDTTHCQYFRAPAPADSLVANAVAQTRNLVVKYRDAIVPSRYSASCGGRTRSLKEASLPAPDYPFYSIECPPCARSAATWETRLNVADAGGLLTAPGSERLRSQIVRKLGSAALPGSNYRLRREGDDVVLNGRGRGHGIGLCQEGAVGLAALGATWQAIIDWYLPNTSVSAIY